MQVRREALQPGRSSESAWKSSPYGSHGNAGVYVPSNRGLKQGCKSSPLFLGHCTQGREDANGCAMSDRPSQPPFRATCLTLFPEAFPGILGVSIVGNALRQGLWALDTVDIRT